MHSHTSGISTCCQADAETVIKIAKDTLIEGLVLTNHYQSAYVVNNDSLAFAEKYIEEYKTFDKIGEREGVKTFFGLEVTAEKHKNAHLLVYGVDEEFVLKYHDMFAFTQEKLYGLVKDNGGILVWAHPFRGGYNDSVSLKYLDGLEINCHPKYGKTYLDEISALAKENNLFLTCGGDYHHDTPYRPYCGTVFNDDVKDLSDITNYLKTSNEINLLVQEPYAGNSFIYTYLNNGKF